MFTPRFETRADGGKLRGKPTRAQLEEERSNSQSSSVTESAASGVSSPSLDVCRQRPNHPGVVAGVLLYGTKEVGWVQVTLKEALPPSGVLAPLLWAHEDPWCSSRSS